MIPLVIYERMAPGGDHQRIEQLLSELDQAYIPPISSLVNIFEYSRKLADLAWIIFAAADDGDDKALCAMYLNDREGQRAYITSFGVRPACQRRGIGRALIGEAFALAVGESFRFIDLQVHSENETARKFYADNGFLEMKKTNGFIELRKSMTAADISPSPLRL